MGDLDESVLGDPHPLFWIVQYPCNLISELVVDVGAPEQLMPVERLNILSAAARNSAAFSPYFALGCTSTIDPTRRTASQVLFLSPLQYGCQDMRRPTKFAARKKWVKARRLCSHVRWNSSQGEYGAPSQPHRRLICTSFIAKAHAAAITRNSTA